MPQLSKPRARHSSKELGRRLARRAGLSVLAVALFVVSGAGFAWHNIQSRITYFNVDSILSEEGRPGTKPPDSYDGRAVNLLVLGTDSRSGNNNVDGSEGSDEVSVARSDTALVMHISADRKRIDAVSIPRDTEVDIPECKSLDGETAEAQENQQFIWQLAWLLGRHLALRIWWPLPLFRSGLAFQSACLISLRVKDF